VVLEFAVPGVMLQNVNVSAAVSNREASLQLMVRNYHKTDHCPSYPRKQFSCDNFQCSLNRQLNIAVNCLALFTRENCSQNWTRDSSDDGVTRKSIGQPRNRSWIVGSVVRYLSSPVRSGTNLS
jgi:hypothetical protein